MRNPAFDSDAFLTRVHTAFHAIQKAWESGDSDAVLLFSSDGLAERFRSPPQTGDFNLRLAAPGAGNNGSVRIDATVPSWLRFDWDAASPGDENPWGHAAFGLYKGEAGQIYLREVY